MSEPPPRAPWSHLGFDSRGFATAYNEVYSILLDTARHRGCAAEAPELDAATRRVAADVAAVVLFWRTTFEEDGQYDDFPRMSHAYTPHHAIVVVEECRKGVCYKGVTYVPAVRDPAMPTSAELRAIRPKTTQFTSCCWLFKQRLQFYHDVSYGDRCDKELFKCLGTRDRVDEE